MSIHIGNLIRQVVNEKRISVTDLAANVKLHIGSISRIYSYPSMQLDSLKKFSIALQYDFFEHYSKELNFKKEETNSQSDSEKLIESKNIEIESLKKEILYLKQINELLMKK